MKVLVALLLLVLTLVDAERLAATLGPPKGTSNKLNSQSRAGRRRRNLKGEEGEGEGESEGGGESDGGGGGGGGACFAASASVQVLGQGTLTMDKLEVGERVEVDGSKFEPIYGFYKREHDSVNSFVKIETDHGEPLELTGSHLLFVDGLAKRAMEVQVGDVLNGGLKVVKISGSTKKGIYSPLTYSGKIVVNNGIEASTYGTVTENSSSMEIGGFEVGVDLHHWLHFIQTYHRLTCKLKWDFCQNESYDEDGYSRMFYLAPFYKWWMAQNWLVGALVFVPVAAGLAVLRLGELMMHNIALTVVGAIIVTVSMRFKNKKTVV